MAVQEHMLCCSDRGPVAQEADGSVGVHVCALHAVDGNSSASDTTTCWHDL